MVQDSPTEFKSFMYKRYIDTAFLLFKSRYYENLFSKYSDNKYPKTTFPCEPGKPRHSYHYWCYSYTQRHSISYFGVQKTYFHAPCYYRFFVISPIFLNFYVLTTIFHRTYHIFSSLMAFILNFCYL